MLGSVHQKNWRGLFFFADHQPKWPRKSKSLKQPVVFIYSWSIAWLSSMFVIFCWFIYDKKMFDQPVHLWSSRQSQTSNWSSSCLDSTEGCRPQQYRSVNGDTPKIVWKRSFESIQFGSFQSQKKVECHHQWQSRWLLGWRNVLCIANFSWSSLLTPLDG